MNIYESDQSNHKWYTRRATLDNADGPSEEVLNWARAGWQTVVCQVELPRRPQHPECSSTVATSCRPRLRHTWVGRQVEPPRALAQATVPAARASAKNNGKLLHTSPQHQHEFGREYEPLPFRYWRSEMLSGLISDQTARRSGSGEDVACQSEMTPLAISDL